MISAALLRKEIVSALQEQVIPDLLSGGVRHLVTAHLPLKAPAGVTVREMKHPPLKEEDAQRIYPEGKKWDREMMHALRFPALYCLIEGEADLAMGVTTSMLDSLALQDRPNVECGGYIISLRTPAYFFVPPGIPQKTTPPWQRETPHLGVLRLFIVRILPVGALCTITTMHDSEYLVPYSLLIKDKQLGSAMEILVDELSAPSADLYIAQAQLITLMLRLKRRLDSQIPFMTDGLYSRFPDSEPTLLPDQTSHYSVIERVHKYIQLHLHEPLNPKAIAEQVQLSPDHLNRIFRKRIGLTLMSYVTQCRVESAQLLLRTSDLSVQEISLLVGYRHLPHFSRTFTKLVGLSPLKFRQEEKGSP